MKTTKALKKLQEIGNYYMYRICLIFSIMTIAGCASYSQMLINADGRVVHCAQTGGGLIGLSAATIAHDQCIAGYKSLGYIPLEEAGGIGVRLATDSGPTRVLAVVENTPASKAGISAGDFIVSVDGQAVSNSNDAQRLLRGRANTPVSIVIRRGTDEKIIAVVRSSLVAVQSTSSPEKP